MVWTIIYAILAVLCAISGWTNWFGPSLWVSQVVAVIFGCLALLKMAAPSTDDPPLYRSDNGYDKDN